MLSLAIQANLTDELQVRALVDTTRSQFGRLDVLVHYAATWHQKRLEEITAADVRESFETNTLSTFLWRNRRDW